MFLFGIFSLKQTRLAAVPHPFCRGRLLDSCEPKANKSRLMHRPDGARRFRPMQSSEVGRRMEKSVNSSTNRRIGPIETGPVCKRRWRHGQSFRRNKSISSKVLPLSRLTAFVCSSVTLTGRRFSLSTTIGQHSATRDPATNCQSELFGFNSCQGEGLIV